MNRVKNKAALITGGASGLGLASGKLLLEEGAKVIFTDINREELEKINCFLVPMRCRRILFKRLSWGIKKLRSF